MLECLNNEDERNEHREGLFREARDELDEERQVERHDEHEEQETPGAYPEAEAHEVDAQQVPISGKQYLIEEG